MGSQLTKLLDRDFIVGYFLPVLVFVSANLAVVTVLGKPEYVLNTLKDAGFLLGTTIIVLTSALVGVILLVLNRDIIRLIEGYGRYNPARMLQWRQSRRYKNLTRDIDNLTAERDYLASRGKAVPGMLRAQRQKLSRERAEQFPLGEHLLPTAVGNAIRAAEVYPYLVYGIDTIEGWNRLIAVIPKEYSNMISGAKSYMDFWVNLWLLSLLFALEYMVISVTGTFDLIWLCLIALAVALLSPLGIRSAAIEWGSLLKASFDVFLPDLRTKLELSYPADIEEERQQWGAFSRVILYRDASSVPKRSQPQLQGIIIENGPANASRAVPGGDNSTPEEGEDDSSNTGA